MTSGESIIVRAEHLGVYVFAVTLEVVIADDRQPGHVEMAETVAHPFEFLGDAIICHVASVDNEIYVSSGIDAGYCIIGVVIPSLGIADEGKLELSSEVEPFKSLAVGIGQMCVTLDSAFIGVIIE